MVAYLLDNIEFNYFMDNNGEDNMKEWLIYKYFEFFVWWGHKVLGYNEVTLHLGKNKSQIIGVTFGRIK